MFNAESNCDPMPILVLGWFLIPFSESSSVAQIRNCWLDQLPFLGFPHRTCKDAHPSTNSNPSDHIRPRNLACLAKIIFYRYLHGYVRIFLVISSRFKYHLNIIKSSKYHQNQQMTHFIIFIHLLSLEKTPVFAGDDPDGWPLRQPPARTAAPGSTASLGSSETASLRGDGSSLGNKTGCLWGSKRCFVHLCPTNFEINNWE